MMNRPGDYYYVPKRARKRGTHANEAKMPTDTGLSRAVKPPINYPEAGPDNNILPANKVVVNPPKKWVDKFFQPIHVPDQGVGDITTQTFMPTTMG